MQSFPPNPMITTNDDEPCGREACADAGLSILHHYFPFPIPNFRWTIAAVGGIPGVLEVCGRTTTTLVLSSPSVRQWKCFSHTLSTHCKQRHHIHRLFFLHPFPQHRWHRGRDTMRHRLLKIKGGAVRQPNQVLGINQRKTDCRGEKSQWGRTDGAALQG
ncbi:uncharacterized protein EI90DRAFT_2370145 [Cantharellus anzutake]|uniref:uncharacterized protein n=1 Tax=Cantharellus anzutake TaxID=1750568 RepID=UPI001905A0A7|nr:uncharacterized protein EI90DRAFT_2370145 [Cantharellus anzutake]KAF8324218.1 hypothetical protein EI90DRAFT_2370145 [Cantharellus anzutake]